METRQIWRNFTNGVPETTRARCSRRSVLAFAGAFGAASPFGGIGAARALTASGGGSLPHVPGEALICRAATNGEELQRPPRQLKLAWNANSVCTAAAPVAKERGIFAKHNLDVDFVNFGGSTDQLLEAIATGLPVVTTRHGGIPEAVDDRVNGLLADERSPVQVAEGLLEITRNERKGPGDFGGGGGGGAPAPAGGFDDSFGEEPF